MVTRGVRQELKRQGFVVLKPGQSQGAQAGLLSLSEEFGAVIRHPLGDEHGIVRVTPRSDLREFGDVFTDRAVALHTDGAFMDDPPYVVALQCEVAPERGGETCLLDGRVLYDHLRNIVPDGFTALFDYDAMTIVRGGEAATRPMFSRHGCRTHVRFRLDGGVHVSFSSKAAPLMPRIQSFLRDPDRRSWISLQPGDILILDNRRMLHGRNGFAERPVRLMNRVWFDGHSTAGIECGFESADRRADSALLPVYEQSR